jgi:hypothetical protein
VADGRCAAGSVVDAGSAFVRQNDANQFRRPTLSPEIELQARAVTHHISKEHESMFINLTIAEGLKKTLNTRYIVEVYPSSQPSHTDIKMADGKVYTLAKDYDTIIRTLKDMTSTRF